MLMGFRDLSNYWDLGTYITSKNGNWDLSLSVLVENYVYLSAAKAIGQRKEPWTNSFSATECCHFRHVGSCRSATYYYKCLIISPIDFPTEI